MLKGENFSGQTFHNYIHSVITNRSMNGKSGIVKDYLNEMQATFSGANVTIQSGVAIICGRILYEDTNTTITAELVNAFNSLVLEINMSNQNPYSFKILSNSLNFPTLQQDDIAGEQNSGVYQLEIARFVTDLTEITSWQDRREFIKNSDASSINFDNSENSTDATNVQDALSKILGKDLYSNSNGSTSNIVLSEDIENFSYFEIEFYAVFSLNRVYSTTGKIPVGHGGIDRVHLNSSFIGSGGALQTFCKRLHIAGKNLTVDSDRQGGDGEGAFTYITKVKGYK